MFANVFGAGGGPLRRSEGRSHSFRTWGHSGLELLGSHVGRLAVVGWLLCPPCAGWSHQRGLKGCWVKTGPVSWPLLESWFQYSDRYALSRRCRFTAYQNSPGGALMFRKPSGNFMVCLFNRYLDSFFSFLKHSVWSTKPRGRCFFPLPPQGFCISSCL